MMEMSHLWNDENVSPMEYENVSMMEMSHLWNDGNVSPVE